MLTFVAVLLGTAQATPCTEGYALPPTATSALEADGSLRIEVGAPWVVEGPEGSAWHTCSCPGGDCEPTAGEERTACEGAGCSTCDETRSGVILDLDGVRVVEAGRETDQLDLIDLERALELPDVRPAYEAFKLDAQQGLTAPPFPEGDEAPDGWTHLLVSVFGHHAFVLVPDDGRFAPSVTAKVAWCECTLGNDSCEVRVIRDRKRCYTGHCAGKCGGSGHAFTVLEP